MSSRPHHVSTKAIIASLLASSGLVLLSTLSTDLSQYMPPIDDLLYPVVAATALNQEKRETPSSTSPVLQLRNEEVLSNVGQHSLPRSRSGASDVKFSSEEGEDESTARPAVFSFDALDHFVNKTIRTWGCNRKETPLIFVHIGKAGGGLVRARFAAAAIDYNREDWHAPRKDQHYYPIYASNKASFCNSQYKTFNIPNTQLWEESFEGNLPCNATTPIGMALACPETGRERQRCLGCLDWKSNKCRTVYVGHNALGSELHFLPPKYLRNWWRSTPWSSNSQSFSVDWRGIYDGTKYGWCTDPVTQRKQFRSNITHSTYESLFEECSVPIGDYWDSKFKAFWRNLPYDIKDFDNDNGNEVGGPNVPINYSPLYASLPIQRVTMVREPWSWLVSKFFWHHDLDSDHVCDDLTYAQEWTKKYALQYTNYLCGGDCVIRYERNLMTLEELWIQSESNLRHAFSVVGLMNETMTFYEMLSTRVSYLDMSLNPRVQGERHESGRNRETVRCRRVFKDPAFQMSLKEQVPILHVLDRLYHVAVKVNRFQLEELRECQGRRGSLWSKQHFHL